MKQTKIPIFICEPDIKDRQRLTSLLSHFFMISDPPLTIAYEGDQPHELLRTMNDYSISGIFFLSIDILKDFDGVLLGKEIRDKDDLAKIIYISKHPNGIYKVASNKIQALDFIIKDCTESYLTPYSALATRIIDALTVAYQRLLTNHPGKIAFTYKQNGNVYSIPFPKIISFETGPEAHQITMWTTERKYSFYGTLSGVLSKMPQQFIRISRSEVVNLHHVSTAQLGGKLLTLSDSRSAYIATRYLLSVKRALQS